MSLTRPKVEIFASKAGNDELAVFGSLHNGKPKFSNNSDEIQSENYLRGWHAAVVADNNPTIEDFNAQGFVFSSALKYLFSAGVAQYSSNEIYHKGSFVNNEGELYCSLINDNQAQPLDNPKAWQSLKLNYAPYAVGDIYTQYPGQKSPAELYPFLNWADITPSYAGQFFRAEGNLSLLFESGTQEESLPNITGSMDNSKTSDFPSEPMSFGDAFEISGAISSFNRKDISTTSSNVTSSGAATYGFTFDASFSSSTYGRRNEVAPINQSIKLWRRVGSIHSHSVYYRYDCNGIYQGKASLDIDEVGVIGLNPNTMTAIEPPFVELERDNNNIIIVFDRTKQEWSSHTDYRNKTIWNKHNAQSRTITTIGDLPNGNETLLSPEGVIYPQWNEELQKWITNTTKQNEAEQQQQLAMLRESIINKFLLQDNDYSRLAQQLHIKGDKE
jgi:hypothetical protein